MDPTLDDHYSQNFERLKSNLTNNTSNQSCSAKSMYFGSNYQNNQISNIKLLNNKRERPLNTFKVTCQAQLIQDHRKCFKCFLIISEPKVVCSNCLNIYHVSCLILEEYQDLIKKTEEEFKCSECKLQLRKMYCNKYNNNNDINNASCNNNNYHQNDSQNKIISQKKSQPLFKIDTPVIFSKTTNSFENNSNVTNVNVLNILLNQTFVKDKDKDKINDNQHKKFQIVEQNQNSNTNSNSLVSLQQNMIEPSQNKSSLNNNDNIIASNYHNELKWQKVFHQDTIDNCYDHHKIDQTLELQSIIPVNQYPIEDIKLFNTPLKYNIPPDIFIRPKGIIIPIEYSLFNKIIILWDFLLTYKIALFTNDIELPIPIPDNPTDFYELFESNTNRFFSTILFSFLILFIKNLNNFDITTQTHEEYILRSFLNNEGSSIEIIINHCYSEIIKIMMNKLNNKTLLSETTHFILSKVVLNQSLNKLSIEESIIILYNFIAIAYDTIIIKEIIKYEFQKSSVLIIERNNHENLLRDSDSRRKKIMHSDYFIHAKTTIEDLNKQLQNEVSKSSLYDIKKEICKYHCILKENDMLIEKNNKILKKIFHIKAQILSLKIPRKRLLGRDYCGIEFYIFNYSPVVFYLKNKIEKQWTILKKKEEIVEVYKKLSDKGINERKLKSSIKKILQEIMIKEKKAQFQKKTNQELKQHHEEHPIQIQHEQIEESHVKIQSDDSSDLWDPNKDYHNTNNNKDYYSDKTITDIINIQEDEIPKTFFAEVLLKIEMIYTNYYFHQQREWESFEYRAKWRSIISQTEDPINFITSLIMLNHRFKNPYTITTDNNVFKKNNSKNDDAENDDKEYIVEEYEISETDPKYIFKCPNEEFFIFENDPNKILASKVNIWSKEMFSIEVNKYFDNYIVYNIKNNHQLAYALHFFEYSIIGLIHRKKLKRQIN